MLPELERRRVALEKTMAKYKAKPFAWGKSDCATLLRSHLVAMGHRKVPKLPAYDSALGAKRALGELGFETMEQLLDSLLPRIAPAMMLPGDIAVTGGPEGSPLDAVVIGVGFKVYGFHEDGEDGAVVITPDPDRPLKGAWRG